MSEGIWDAPDDGGWDDASLVSERQPEAWGAPEGSVEPEPAAEQTADTTTIEPVTEAEVVAELEAEQQQEEPAERPRDEKGRFVKQEEAVTESQPDEMLLGKFKSADDLVRAYQELEQHTGGLRQELGQLRQEVQTVAERAERPTIPSNWETLLDDNPAQAAKLALDAGDRAKYEEAKRVWDSESPGAPELYEQTMLLNYELEQVKEAVAATQAPQVEQMQVNATAQALATVKQQHPDFDDFETGMSQLMQERPLYMSAFKEAVVAADVSAQAAILNDLYDLVAGRRSDNLTQAQQEVNRDAAEQQLRARQDAVVVSATSNASEPVLSEADRIAAEWDKLDAPYRTGWLEP